MTSVAHAAPTRHVGPTGRNRHRLLPSVANRLRSGVPGVGRLRSALAAGSLWRREAPTVAVLLGVLVLAVML